MDGSSGGGGIKAPQDFAAGVFLLVLALFALWLGSNLNPGTMRNMGPGMLPRAIAVLIGIVGLTLVVGSLLTHGPKIDKLSLRGPFFICLGIISFGLTVRGFPIGGGFSTPALGLLGAGPLAIMISGFASAETKWGQLALFAVVMTAFCWALFKLALNLPIPLSPIVFGY